MSVLLAPAFEELINARWSDARARLQGRATRLRVLAPPFPCVGTGELRVVRAVSDGDQIELVLTYADFKRL
ncbi:MAG TPA: hypothetical protein VGX02_06125 [Candidatus Eremiobacteraceae bacterium]|nr:hypothetical protein [Candidatus Eremiobacteraceae bacterium]